MVFISQRLGQCLVAVLGFLLMSLPVYSQEKWPIPSADSDGKYVEERVIDVGDVPGHQLRIYNLTSTFPKKDLKFLGVNVVSSSSIGSSDYIGKSGSFNYYIVYVLENGDKIFGRGSGASVSNPDGGRKYSFIENLSGGTGKFKGVRGQLRGSGERAPGADGVTESQSGEYWVEQ